nr:DUF2341 domain-containing protein [Candidatus Sigynarchaeota archaeon]
MILCVFLVGLAITFVASPSTPGLQEGNGRIHTSDATYTYAINISPVTPASDYTIRLNLNGSFNYSACKANGDDIRFYDVDNISLSYWIETWNVGGKSTIWVKIPQAGTSEIRISYGDSLATAASDGDATFVFFDHFTGAGINTTSKWNVVTDMYSSVNQTDGTYALLVSNPPTKERSAIYIGFNDYYLSGGTMMLQNGVFYDGDYFKNRRASDSTYQQTAFNAVDQWRTYDLCWISSSSIKYYTNDTLRATHTSGIPATSIPVSIWASTIYSDTGNRYAGYLRSKTTNLGQAGYAFRCLSWADYDYSSYSVYAQVKVDWCFVRRCTAIEPVATLLLPSIPGPTPIIYNLPFMESFEWGNIPAVNTITNTFERVNDSGATYTGWDSKEYSSSGGLLLANNFVNTTMQDGSQVLHMENRDDASSGFHHSQVRALFNTTGFLNNLTIRCTVQGSRYDGAADNSAVAIYIIEDTNNDGLFEIGGNDFQLVYVMDFNGVHDTEGPIDHFKSNKIVTAWVPISTDWDGTTWYNMQRNITTDWIHYMGWAMNKTNLAVVITNSQRVDMSSTAYYMWSNWDNFTLGNAFSPDLTPPTITINSPANAAVLDSNIVSLNVNIVDANLAHMWYELDSGSSVSMVSNTSFSAADGTHTIIVYANDTAGNLASRTVSFTVASSAPQVVILSPGNLVYLSNVNLVFHVSSVVLDSMWYTINGSSPIILAGNTTISLVQGISVITVYANDSLGRIGSDLIVVTASLLPVITINSPVNASILGSSMVSLIVNIVDVNLDNMWYKVDDGPSVSMVSNTSFSAEDGSHTVTIFANDTEGNLASETVSFTVASTAPQVAILSPGNLVYLSNVNLVFHVSSTVLDSMWYTKNGSTPIILAGNTTISLVQGTSVITVYANDS